jgi:hypothetical protein
VDFWFHWIAGNEPFDDVVISFTPHIYSTLITSKVTWKFHVGCTIELLTFFQRK